MITLAGGGEPIDYLVDDILQTLADTAGIGDQSVDIPVIANDADLDRFLWDTLGIVLPNVVVCEHKGHTTPWRAFHDAYFARSPTAVWKASRGFGGKSFTLALLVWTEAVTLRADANVLGGSGEQSERITAALEQFWTHPSAPAVLKSGRPGGARQVLNWGNVIQALTASQAAVRGPHPQRLRCDEVDEMDFGILKSALGQPMSKGPVLSQVVLSSTHQYPDGTMTEVLNLAAEKDWPVYEWCYRETLEPHGWLTSTEVNRKRSQMTTLDWVTEVDMQEPNPEDLAINRDAVNAAFDPALDLEDDPEPGARYAHGADWGKKTHLAAFASLKLVGERVQLASFQTMNRQSWPVITATFEAQVKHFGGGTTWHDGTGIGDAIHDYLTIAAEPMVMVGLARKALFEDLIMGIEGGEFLIPDVERTRKLKRVLQFVTRAMLFGTGHPPDEVVGLAMAYRAARSWVMPAGTMKQPDPAQSPNLSNMNRERSGGSIFGPRRGLGDLGRRR